MPRPYNWIRGEGTVKNQRWGLGDLTVANDATKGPVFIGDGSNWSGGDNPTHLLLTYPISADVGPYPVDYSNPLSSSIYNATGNNVIANAAGGSVSSSPSLLLIGGIGLALLLLLKR